MQFPEYAWLEHPKNYELIARSQEKQNFLTTLTNADSHNLLFSNYFLKK